MIFTASSVVCTEHEGVAMVAFADNAECPRYYLIMQQDAAQMETGKANLATVHIEVNSQIHSGYGAVQSAILSTDRLIVSLHDNMASALGIDKCIDVRFILKNIDELRTYLTRMLGAAICVS